MKEELGVVYTTLFAESVVLSLEAHNADTDPYSIHIKEVDVEEDDAGTTIPQEPARHAHTPIPEQDDRMSKLEKKMETFCQELLGRMSSLENFCNKMENRISKVEVELETRRRKRKEDEEEEEDNEEGKKRRMKEDKKRKQGEEEKRKKL